MILPADKFFCRASIQRQIKQTLGHIIIEINQKQNECNDHTWARGILPILRENHQQLLREASTQRSETKRKNRRGHLRGGKTNDLFKTLKLSCNKYTF